MAAPSSLRVSSIELDPTAELAQKAQEANLVSLFLAQQLVSESDRQHDETYKQSQLMQDAVSGALSLGDVMSDAYFAAEMENLEAGEGIKRRHRRSTKRRRRRHRDTKKHRRHRRSTKKHRRHRRSTKKHRRHRRGR